MIPLYVLDTGGGFIFSDAGFWIAFVGLFVAFAVFVTGVAATLHRFAPQWSRRAVLGLAGVALALGFFLMSVDATAAWLGTGKNEEAAFVAFSAAVACAVVGLVLWRMQRKGAVESAA